MDISALIKRLELKLMALAVAVIFICCSENIERIPKPQSNSINKILPLGASRVEGASPYYESFRYELWKKLSENDWIFDFIGTQSDPASYPNLGSLSFDVDHEGRGGWTSADILNGLSEWLNMTGAPDIVLFSSPGGNDILNGSNYEQTLLNINAIIDLLQLTNPNVTILIEQLAAGHSDFMTAEYTATFNQNKEDILNIASAQTTENSQVIAVDMFTGFTDDFLADDVHYNQAGAEFIANRYYDRLIQLMEQ